MVTGALQIAPLALGIGGSIGIIGAAVALGIRHGIDWDHIAAITDITSTSASLSAGDESWLTAEPGLMLTDESHHSVAKERLQWEEAALVQKPALVGAPAPRFVLAEAIPRGSGLLSADWHFLAVPRFFSQQRPALLLGTLYALGHGTVVAILGLSAILARNFLPDWIDPIMERVVGATLILLAAYLFYAVYRFFRGGDGFRLRSRWMLVFAGIRSLLGWLQAKARHERHHQHVGAAEGYGPRAAFTVGMIHGIGAETGTQVLVIASAVGAATKAMGVAALLGFVAGLLISNSILTVASTAGFLSAQRRQMVYVLVGLLAGSFSLVVGTIFLLQSGAVLPDLGHYFRWIGGSST